MPGEVVVPTAMVNAGAVDHLRGSLPGFAAGGLVGDVKGMVPWASSAETQFGKSTMTSWVEAAAKAAIAAVAPGPASGGGFTHWAPGAGVMQWAGDVRSALGMLGLPSGLWFSVLYQMLTESGGNPNIVNRSDSNWAAGHPSVGLMQVIQGTFDAYAGPYRNTGPFEYGVSVNPMANIYSALNYAAHNGRGFGSGPGQLGSGHGYAAGGDITEPIWGIGASGQRYSFGEKGRETVIPGGGIGDLHGALLDIADAVDNVAAHVKHLTSVTAAAPARTGAALGQTLSGVARNASNAALY
jgi:SLT domain-containing protein